MSSILIPLFKKILLTIINNLKLKVEAMQIMKIYIVVFCLIFLSLGLRVNPEHERRRKLQHFHSHKLVAKK